MLYAARKGKPSCVVALCEAGANVNLRDHNGASAISMASKNGHLAIVETLLAHKANVRTRDTPALLAAAKKGHLKIVQMLLEHGADKMVQTADGKVSKYF